MFEYDKEGINLPKFLNTLKELRTLRKQKKAQNSFFSKAA